MGGKGGSLQNCAERQLALEDGAEHNTENQLCHFIEVGPANKISFCVRGVAPWGRWGPLPPPSTLLVKSLKVGNFVRFEIWSWNLATVWGAHGKGCDRMTSWAERMHRRAATFSNVVTSCGHPSVPYPRRLEKVKFGVPLDEVCKQDIPGPLLVSRYINLDSQVLVLKLNKEAPFKKDVFRAPGHQGNMKKLIHFLQAGRLVNIDNFSVYTIASVLKKFLRKLPGGIFGREGEQALFTIIGLESMEEQRDQIHRLITSLPTHTQRLLVLLFGTFRVIAMNSERARTGMTSEALGVSVAPSFFQSCVSDGKTAKMEDVMRFKGWVKMCELLLLPKLLFESVQEHWIVALRASRGKLLNYWLTEALLMITVGILAD
uniref:Rho-GAP domain-containing protein n=1 Tax=Timema bartmani TaxID=61472 RepID=A0A7R9F1U3_9NEOP|nr:unnamed protein product [Timema bartmani]